MSFGKISVQGGRSAGGRGAASAATPGHPALARLSGALPSQGTLQDPISCSDNPHPAQRTSSGCAGQPFAGAEHTAAYSLLWRHVVLQGVL